MIRTSWCGQLAAPKQGLGQALGAPDQECYGWGSPVAPSLEPLGKLGAGQRLAAGIERDDCGIFGNRGGETRSFLADAVAPATAAALFHFDGVDGAEPEPATERGDAFAITRREVALRARFQPTDRGDDELHRAPAGEFRSACPARRRRTRRPHLLEIVERPDFR